jgi:hypothetical protein
MATLAEPETETEIMTADMSQIADWPYSFKVLPLKHLFVDESYQRPPTSFVKRIVNNFNPALVNCLCVSERSKTRHAIIDGQTRWIAMGELGHTDVPCLVFHRLSQAEEAKLFGLFQTERRGVTSASLFKSKVVAGDPVAVAIDEVITNLGWEIPEVKSSAPNVLQAPAALMYVYHGCATGLKAKREHNPQLLAQTLEVIEQAWPKRPATAKGASMIRGLGFFLWRAQQSDKRREREIDLERLALRLGRQQPSELFDRARKLRESEGVTTSSPRYLADVIAKVYQR